MTVSVVQAGAAIGDYEVPAGWGVSTIGGLFCIQQGKALSAAARNAPTRYPFLRTSNVLWGRLNLTSVDQMGLSEAERAKLRLARGDLLVCEGGEIGRAAIWDESIEDCFFQNHIHRLRPITDGVAPAFYAYWLQLAFTRLGVYEGAGTKTTIANLSGGRLANLQVPVPPLEEQQRIARILSTIQASMQANRSALNGVRRLKVAYTKHFLEGENPYTSVHLADIDVLIETGPFGSQLHAHEYTTEGVLVLNPMHLGENGINADAAPVFISEVTAGRLSRHRLQTGDVVVPRRGDLSRYVLIRDELVGQLCGTGSIKLRFSDSRISSAYFALYFGSARAQRYLKDAATGTIMPNISPKVLEGLPVLVPPRDVQDQIVAGWDAVDCYERAILGILERNQSLFDSCLSSLMVNAA